MDVGLDVPLLDDLEGAVGQRSGGNPVTPVDGDDGTFGFRGGGAREVATPEAVLHGRRQQRIGLGEVALEQGG